MVQPTYSEALKRAFLLLKKQQLDPEAAQYVLLERQHWRQTDLRFHEHERLPVSVWQQFQADLQQLLAGIPPQYLLGYAYFDQLKLIVSPATLIPRFETEELVAWVDQSLPQQGSIRVLDLGTGSGAIALALKQRQKQRTIWASDISTAALKVAQKNAQKLDLPVHLRKSDLFQALPKDLRFDAIVCNPPYISRDEMAVMDRSVRQFEPPSALFAADEGLYYYRKIMATVADHLQPQGQLFFEFGYQQKTWIETLAQKLLPQAKLTIKNDLAGWPRMARLQFS